jgi:hypothetical protein
MTKCRVPLTEATKRQLLAESAGYCANPECHAELIRVTNAGGSVTVADMAHIIASSVSGPRGDPASPASTRADPVNLLVLCPSCHRLVDAAPDQFPAHMLQRWKAEHREQIRRIMSVPRVDSREELRELLEPLLNKNKAVHQQYGPESYHAPTSEWDAAEMWKREVKETIIPNNRRLAALLDRNAHLLTDEERTVVLEFQAHIVGLEYNHLSGDRNAAAPRFPPAMERMSRDNV